MTVKELITLLQKEDQDAIVIVSKDAGGNGYSPFSGLWSGAYKAESTWSGDAGLASLTSEDREAGYTEEDIVDGESAVILCPVQ